MNGAAVNGGAPGADLVAVLRFYVDTLLREVPGMKVLLLDQDTTRVVSTVFSQSEILEQEVYLVEKLEADKGDQLFHLKVGAAGGRPAGTRAAVAAPADVPALPRCTLNTLPTSLPLLRRRCASCGPPGRTLLASGASCGTLALESTTCVSGRRRLALAGGSGWQAAACRADCRSSARCVEARIVTAVGSALLALHSRGSVPPLAAAHAQGILTAACRHRPPVCSAPCPLPLCPSPTTTCSLHQPGGGHAAAGPG